MTQDELWQQKYQEVVEFIETHHQSVKTQHREAFDAELHQAQPQTS